MKRTFKIVVFLFLLTGSQSNQSAQGLSPEKFTAAQAHVIVPGAVVSITVDQDRNLNRAYSVPNDGVIDYPPLGRVIIAGLTTEEVAERVRSALAKDYYLKATVTVTIESAPGSGRGVIYVIGHVNRPGPVTLPKQEQFTITKAIGAAGDLSTAANGEKVQLIRYDAAGKKHVAYINVDQIIKRGESEKDVPVQNGDWIVVP